MKRIFLGVSAVLGMSCCFASNDYSNHVAGKKIVLAQANTTNLTPAQGTVKVGACYGGGVIYWLNPDPNAPVGRRGLIVALSDAMDSNNVSKFALTTNGIAPAGLARSNFSGLSNTTILYRATSPAAKAARVNNANTATCDGCTEWYLPSQEEISLLYYQLKIHQDTGNNIFTPCGGTSPLPPELSQSKHYWSSSVRYITTSQSAYGWTVVFSDGLVDEGTGSDGSVGSYMALGTTLNVRSVRAF